jgi:predicted deacylase
VARKLITSLRARATEGQVLLSAYKSTPAFNKANDDDFRTIRVFRRIEPGFTFGADYAEFFDGLSHDDAGLLFEGALQAGNNRKFTFEDADVKVGCTYSYWMGGAQGDPTGPVAVKVRDGEVWWSYDRIEQEVRALKEAHPGRITVTTSGYTAQRKPVLGLRAGTGERALALVGAVHAGESGPELILPVLRELLAGQPDLLKQVSVAAVPVANADERERLARGVPWYLRTNANGVDLNRNFPADWDTVDYNYGLDTSDPDSMTYRGKSPASEPETQALIAFLQEQKPVAVFAHHCLASICGAHFLAPKCAQTDTEMGPAFKAFADAFGAGMAPEFEEQDFFAYGTSAGSLPTYCYRELGIPAFDIEMSGREKEPLRKCRADLTDRPLLREYQQRHLSGVTNLLRTIAQG